MKTENHSVTACDSVSTLAATVWKNKLFVLRQIAPTMTTTMTWSALLIMAYGIYKAHGVTSSADCRSPPYAIVGQPTWMQFRLSGDPKQLRKFMYIRRTESTDASHAGAKEDFVLEGTYNNQKKDMDIILPHKGYYYGGVNNNFLTLYIIAVEPQHEGTYAAEDHKGTVFCHLKVLTDPPSTPAPDSSTDAEKYSSAADPPSTPAPNISTDAEKNRCTADVHKEDCKAWIQMCWGVFGLVIVVMILCGLPHVFWACLFLRKQSAAGKKKTDEQGAHGLRDGSQSKDEGHARSCNRMEGAKDRAGKYAVNLGEEQTAEVDSTEDQADAASPLSGTRLRTSKNSMMSSNL